MKENDLYDHSFGILHLHRLPLLVCWSVSLSLPSLLLDGFEMNFWMDVQVLLVVEDLWDWVWLLDFDLTVDNDWNWPIDWNEGFHFDWARDVVVNWIWAVDRHWVWLWHADLDWHWDYGGKDKDELIQCVVDNED